MFSPIRLGLCALAVAAGLTGAARADDDLGPVVVTLRREVSVTESPVCVGHVASLSGGTAALRRQVADLDLADRPRRGKTLSVAQELIAYRIQVAGIARGRFRVQGAAAVQVTPGPAALTEDDFLQAAREALLDRLPLAPADVAVSLALPPAVPQLTLTARDEVRLDAVPRGPVNGPGRLSLDVILNVNGERVGTAPVVVDVKVYQSVAVAEHSVETGEVLTAEDVHFERRAVESADGFLTAQDVKAGQRVRRALMAGQVIPRAAVESTRADSPVLVKQRDLVKMVAHVGAMTVTALAEAQQDGRAGERIRVRNVDSKKDLTGRVVARGVVEVEY
jgi:flagella basal body P-ring formation protein FlgA